MKLPRNRAGIATKTPLRTIVPVDRDQWSEESKRGLDYAFAPTHYEDKPFLCRTCRQPSIFTAEQQKAMYEERKATIYQSQILCAACFRARNALRFEHDTLLAAWLDDKAALMKQPEKLRNWKDVLERLSEHDLRKDTARIRMLEKLLASLNIGFKPT